MGCKLQIVSTNFSAFVASVAGEQLQTLNATGMPPRQNRLNHCAKPMKHFLDRFGNVFL
jgi:hypothetical protein